MRPICEKCNKNVCAINYHRKGTTYYRKICNRCGKNKLKRKPKKYNWEKAGYKLKPACDLCGFKAIYPTQYTVFHIDGNLNNTSFTNLRTICLNCVEVVKRRAVTWRVGDLLVDY